MRTQARSPVLAGSTLNTRPQNGSLGSGLRRIFGSSRLRRGVLLALAVAFVRRVDALDRRHVERAGQVGGHRVQQRLHADAVQGRAAQHRLNLHVDRRVAEHACG